MSDQATTQVRSTALYLEFRHPILKGNTFQMLIHPDSASSNNTYVPFGTFYRTLTNNYPKRPWSRSRVNGEAAKPRTLRPDGLRLETLTDAAEILKTAESFQQHFDGLLDQLERQGYTLFKQPITVEVSNIDYDELANGATPYALMRRVMSARKALGFPDDLIENK